MIRIVLFFGLLSCAYSQARLESVKVEGSGLPQKTVLEFSGLHIGTNIDRAGIEAACKKLEETGFFSSINFRYEPTPRNGYALTLALGDEGHLSAASIDIPGIDDAEVWRWLIVKFPAFDHKIPGDDPAQKVVARQIEEYLGPKLQGQKITVKIEADFATRKSILSFQPENLPRIDAMTFPGAKELAPEQATTVMQKVTADRGYTDRRFRDLLEANLRPAYEERGLYRVQFPQVKIEFINPTAVAVTTTVEEGAKYSLGEVTMTSDDVPAKEMLAAAQFKKSELANWTEIQKKLWDMERTVKRSGYYEAAAKPERVFHDEAHVLDLKIGFVKGPLYHFGQFNITGLSPELDAKARKAWQKAAGDPYDYSYPGDFLRTFSKTVDFRQFKRYDVRAEKGAGDHAMDITLVFEPR